MAKKPAEWNVYKIAPKGTVEAPDETCRRGISGAGQQTDDDQE